MNSFVKKKSDGLLRISIGMPVYNGEQFIRKSLDAILSQTFKDFEIVISDNSSTDATSSICKEYAKKDERIRYIHQVNNMGGFWNLNFVLEQAKYDYFLWAAVDNFFLPTFLEKNIAILETRKNFVGSISKIEIDKNYVDPYKKEKEFLKKLGLVYRPYETLPIVGTYEERVRKYLGKFPWHLFYAIYRTDKLRASMIQESLVGRDGAVVLNVLKYGDIHVVDEVLLYSYPAGQSSKGMYDMSWKFNHGLGKIFSYYPLTAWCAKNLGKKIFLKNLDHFIRLNFDATFLLLFDLFRWFKKMKSREKISASK